MAAHILDLTMRGPILMHGIGTSSNIQLRHFDKRLMAAAGGDVEFVKIFSVDGTGQVARPDLPMLDHTAFLNAAEQPHMVDRLRRAMRHPRIREYLPPKAARLGAGDGAGAIPGAARFLLEQSHSAFIERAMRQLRGFQPGQRAQLAERARGMDWLQQQKMGITVDGAIEVYVVAAMNGGMVAAWPYSTSLLRYVLKTLGIPAKWKLILTPTAYDCGNTPDDLIKKSLAFARFSEVLDYQQGRSLRWPASDTFTIEDAGPFFESIYIMPEPSKNALDAQRQFVGDFLFDVVTPFGKSINDKAVDKVRSSHQLGPHGTPALLHLVGGATLQAAAFDDVVSFAESALGARATAAARIPAAEAEAMAGQIIAAFGLTRRQIQQQRPNVALPELPAGLPANKIEVFLQSSGRRAFGQAANQAKANFSVLRESVELAGKTLRAKLVEPIQLGDIALAAQVSRLVTQKLNGVLAYVRDQSTHLAGDGVATTSSDAERLQKIVGAATNNAFRDQLLRKLQPQLETLVATAEAADRDVQHLAMTVSEMFTHYQDRSRACPAPAPYAVMDRTALLERIDEVSQPTIAAVRECLGQALLNGKLASVRAEVEEAVGRYAEPFRRLQSVQEVLSEDSGDGNRALANALEGAAPNCRIDPDWDDSNVSHQLFITMEEGHPRSGVVEATGREINFVRGSRPGQMRMVRIAFNHEICALVGAREAHLAHLSADDEFPPYADKRYEPQHDVVVPVPTQWYAILALAIHLVLKSGIVRYDKPRGRYFWRDTPLGENRAQACQTLLEEHGRLAGLPTEMALADEAEQLLFQNRTRDEVIDVLREIEERLGKHIGERPSHVIRQTLYQERAAARGLITRLQSRLEDDEKEAENWFDDEPIEDSTLKRDDLFADAPVTPGSRNNGQH